MSKSFKYSFTFVYEHGVLAELSNFFVGHNLDFYKIIMNKTIWRFILLNIKQIQGMSDKNEGKWIQTRAYNSPKDHTQKTWTREKPLGGA